MRLMKRAFVSLLAVWIPFFGVQCANAAPEPIRPNILFIYMDDWGLGRFVLPRASLSKDTQCGSVGSRGYRFSAVQRVEPGLFTQPGSGGDRKLSFPVFDPPCAGRRRGQSKAQSMRLAGPQSDHHSPPFSTSGLCHRTFWQMAPGPESRVEDRGLRVCRIVDMGRSRKRRGREHARGLLESDRVSARPQGPAVLPRPVAARNPCTTTALGGIPARVRASG